MKLDYRRRYFRRIGENQNQPNQVEEKVTIEKIEEKPKMQNVYLHRLLEKTKEVPKNSINLSSVNESLPSFSTNIREILSTEENKQRAIKYVIHKRNEEKFGTRSPVINKNEQEESNPAKEKGNITTTTTIEINRFEISNINNSNNNNSNVESKPVFFHYNQRRNQLFKSQDGINNQEKAIQNDVIPEEPHNLYIRRRFQLSGHNNINNNPKQNSVDNPSKNNSVYQRRVRPYNNSFNKEPKNDNNEKQEQELPKEITKFKYLRSILKKGNKNESIEKRENRTNERNYQIDNPGVFWERRP